MTRQQVNVLVLTCVAVFLGVLRFLGHHGPSFQAVAHLFVGFTLGLWVVTRGRLYAALAVGLTVLEVAAFLYFRK